MVLAAHDWTGELAANGLVRAAVSVRGGQRKQFPKYTLDAFSYGTAMKKLFGIPVQVENIGAAREHEARAEGADDLRAARDRRRSCAKKKNKLAFGICVQQGSGGDAYHMYPFFAGLGGYVFGVNRAGNLDPSDIGVANPVFLQERHA